MKKLNEQIKQEKIMEEKRKREEEEKAKKEKLFKTYTLSKSVVGKLNPYKDIMINKPPQINNNYGFSNPFADMSAGPYNLPLSSKNKSAIMAKLPRKKVVYSKKDKEAQEINKMYMN